MQVYKTYLFKGNFFGRYGKVDDKQCDNNCNGDSTELCGGYERNSIILNIFLYSLTRYYKFNHI